MSDGKIKKLINILMKNHIKFMIGINPIIWSIMAKTILMTITTTKRMITSTQFFFDASGSYDYQTPAGTLNVRWDWEDDGIFDAPYSGMKKRNHKFSQPGTFTVRMEVVDFDGLTDQMTRTIEVGD